MSRRPTALLLTTLDERIRLPLTRWLRVSGQAATIHRLTVSAPEWDALSAGVVPAALGRRILASAELHAPSVIAVLGHERTGADDERRAVQRVVRAVRTLNAGADVEGYFMGASWATGRVDTGARSAEARRREPPATTRRELATVAA
jgi:hypothetical protein